MKYTIYDKTGQIERCAVHRLEYNGEFMGPCSVMCTIKSSEPINFEIGDYLVYRGERFEINYDPSIVKKCSKGLSGEAFVYDSVKFNSLSDELTRCDFLDYVLNDNQIHFTALPRFSFYASSIRDLADRIQANLDRVYKGSSKWNVSVNPEFAGKTNINVDISNLNVWEALALAYNMFDAHYVIKGRNITIGASGVTADHLFQYGKGNGLKEIERQAEQDQLIVTRLRVYGSTRNLPNRYYNKLTKPDGSTILPDNMAVQNLMLPGFPKDTLDPFIDSKNITRLGIREHTIYFDGGEEGLDEIYPSLEGMTAEQLRDAGVNIELDAGDNGKLDEVVSAEQLADNGILPEEGELKPIFTLTIKDVGFDINKYLTTETAVISMKDGMCGGREFEIVKCEKKGNKYELTCNRTEDTSIGRVFPYKDYNIKKGDRFVLLHISMPEAYINAASQRLKKAADEWLKKHDFVRYSYSPKVDDIFMARQHDEAVSKGTKSLHDTLKEGDLMLFSDTDLGIDGAVIIDTLNIKEGEGLIPKYSVVLKDEKTVGTIEKIQQAIESIASGGTGGGGYNLEQIISILKNYGTRFFLRKDQPDQTAHLLKLLGGVEFGKFSQGLLGSGGAVTIDKEGNSHAEFDYLSIRKIAHFVEILVQEMRYVGGSLVLTPAGLTVSKVEETASAYRCYFETTDGDRKVKNQFSVGTQARRQTFDLSTRQAYYWRLVTAVGDNYIDLSKTDADVGSTIPQVGDDIVGLGHRTDKMRQSAIIISAYGDGSPSIKYYQGIDSYSLVDKIVKSDEYDQSSGRFKSTTYGDTYVGAKDRSTYIEFNQDSGLGVKGKVDITAGSTGWKNLDGLPSEIKTAADAAAQASKEAADAQKAADAAQKDADSAAGRLDEWAADGKISPTEKLTLKQELKQLEAEYTDKLGECQKYGVTDTASYTSAWNGYKAQLVAHSADTPENIQVSTAFATTQAAFYKSRTALLAAIADAAKSFVDQSIAGIAIGAVNILRNSGFTGDYLSDELTDSTEMSADKQMYSEALKHWSGMATVADDTDSVSGKSAAIGSLSQPVKLITGEKYVISFKAKGSQVAVSCGNFAKSQALTSAYQKYVFKFTFGGTGVFVLSGTATICDLQLERGTMATEWSPSPLDNNQGISHMQAFEYLVSAIKDGSVDILGGLVLANMIQLGNYKDGKMQQVTAGVSGIYNDADDVAFWAGGNFQQAIDTVMKLKSDPGYNPSDAEWGQLANFVATHGGDLFLRGYIYALGGKFRGTIEGTSGFLRGRLETSVDGKRIVIDPEKQALEMYTESGMLALCINFGTTSDGWDIGRITANKWINKQLALQTIIRSTSISVENRVEGTYADINPNWVTFFGAKQEALQVGLLGIYDKQVLQKHVAYVHSEHWPSKSEAAPGTVYIDWDQNDMGLTGTGTLKIKSK